MQTDLERRTKDHHANLLNSPHFDDLITALDEQERMRLVAATQKWGKLLGVSPVVPQCHPIAATDRPIPVAPAPFVDSPPPPQKVQSRHQFYKERDGTPRSRDRMFEAANNRRPKPRPGQFTVDDLTMDTCHFPVTDESPHKFCGRKTKSGLPYCDGHARICYQKVSRRARQRLLLDALKD